MRIMIVTETFVPATDGISTRLANMILELKKLGHELLVVSPDLGIRDYQGVRVVPIETINFPLYGSRPWGLPSRKIKQVMRSFKPDVVHAVNPFLMATSAVRYAKKLNIPLATSYHTHMPDYLEHYHLSLFKPIVWDYIRYWHKLADVNFTVSETLKRQLLDQGIPTSGVLPAGIDLEARHPHYYDEELYEKLTFNQANQYLLVYVGRLAPEKGLEQLRAIFNYRDDICLAIVGDGPARAHLEAVFEGTQTSFLGFLHDDALSAAFATGDGFIFPSVSETFGLAILEAMASGLPVFAAENGPTLEQIIPNETGFIFVANNETSLLEALDHLGRPLLMDRARLNGRQQAEKYSWGAATRSLLDFYEEAIMCHQSQESLQEEATYN